MIKAKHKTLLVIALLIGGAILSVGNGCSKSFSTSSAGTTGSAGSGPNAAGTGGSSDIPVIPGAKTVSIVNSEQIVDQLSSCVGLASPSGTTLAMYEQKKGAISTYGAANTVTSPMMMAVTSIAGEICNDLIDQEVKSGQRLFVGINMAANTVPTNSQLSDAITRLSLSCWQRNESSSERQLLIDLINSSVSAGENMASRKSALMICTSMLSSLDALLN